MAKCTRRLSLTIIAAVILGTVLPALSEEAADVNGIKKVITLLQDMKAQVETDSKEDTKAYDKYMCWCETNDKEKTAAIATAEERIDSLTTFIEESAANEGALKTEIAGLKEDIAADKDALGSAMGVREEEYKAFLSAEADMKETRSLLSNAIEVLSKVQLLQKNGKGTKEFKQAATALIQVRQIVKERFPQFHSVMQRDLFDMLGSFQAAMPGQSSAFLGGALRKQQAGAFDQTTESQPNDLSGNIAGAKSYNARSGGIVGILGEMQNQFTSDLASSQKEDLKAEISFQNLRVAKLSEIKAATEQQEQKEAALADNLADAAKAKEDKEATMEALSADEEFLMNLKKNCKTEQEEYADRLKARGEELVALGEALGILTDDDSRDLYAKVSFLQVGSSRKAASQTQERAFLRSMQHITDVARRHKNWALASLAVRMKLDAFTKVKEVMDKMLSDLETQQKEEYEKWEQCKADIDKTEDDIKVSTRTKEDLADKHKELSNTIKTLEDEIAALKDDVAAMEVSLKEAGEERKAQNAVFQTSASDERATVKILQKALDRLKQFYSFGQTHAVARVHGRQEPGAAAPPPPPAPKDYKKSAGGASILQIFDMVIADGERTIAALEKGEQRAQEDYATFVQSATASIEADTVSIEEKEAQAAEAKAARSETEEAQMANNEELAKLEDLLVAHHADCDYLLKFFDIRQTARSEEMDAIKDAKAILSGADFGK